MSSFDGGFILVVKNLSKYFSSEKIMQLKIHRNFVLTSKIMKLVLDCFPKIMLCSMPSLKLFEF
jgi:hypothetical protein